MMPNRTAASLAPGAIAANAAAAALRRDESRDFLLTERDFEKIRALIHRRAGISLGSHKREMVYSRLARRLRALQLADFASYLAILDADDASPESERKSLIATLRSSSASWAA